MPRPRKDKPNMVRIDLIELHQSDHAQLKELAERECRTLKDLAALLTRWALLELRLGKIESVSAMSNALFEESKKV